MKPIQMLVLVTALALAVPAQNSSSGSQTGGSSGQTTDTQKKKGKTPASSESSHKSSAASQNAPVTLTVPKSNNQTAAGKKPATSANSTVGKSATPATSTSKTSAQQSTAQNSTGSIKGSTGKTGGSAVAGKKPAVIAVKPATQTTPGPTKTAATGKEKKKGAAAAAVIAKKKTQVKVVPQKTASNKKPPAALLQQLKTSAANRRDPFVSIIRTAPAGPGGPNCTVGKRCLYIPELVLKGIAKDTDGQMLAVVVSNTHRAYFLRENDQVFNGSVQKITTDSVIFREFATDHLGRETAHEIVKRIPKT